MEAISYEELLNRWEKSKIKIKELLSINDISTVNMLKLYNFYIRSPYNKTLKDLFELSFNGWYNTNMKGENCYDD